MAQRRFLFLQGPAGAMFPRLADRLNAQGAAVHRVNVCGGDAMAWGQRPAWRYGGPAHAFAEWLAARLRAESFSDVVLFGCRRPLHAAAIPVLREHGARIHVFEEGYIRPHWISVERLGDGPAPALPRDPRWYREVHASLAAYAPPAPIRVPLALRAWREVQHHMLNASNPMLYPGYRTHRQHVAAHEALGFAQRFAAMPLAAWSAARCLRTLLASNRPYFLLPLQLDGDAQIVHNSPFAAIADAIAYVMRSFAAHAPGDAYLVIKNHPLDAGLSGHRQCVARLSAQLDLQSRVVYVETAHLPTLLARARGTVVVNSTVGMSALSVGCPTKALAQPFYDLPGLTSRAPLDAFWRAPVAPDASLFQALHDTVIHATQVNGDFVTRRGIALAVDGCERMLGELSPLEVLVRQFGRPGADARTLGPELRSERGRRTGTGATADAALGAGLRHRPAVRVVAPVHRQAANQESAPAATPP